MFLSRRQSKYNENSDPVNKQQRTSLNYLIIDMNIILVLSFLLSGVCRANKCGLKFYLHLFQMSGEKAMAFADGEHKVGDEYTYKKDFRTALPQFLAVSAKNLLLLGAYLHLLIYEQCGILTFSRLLYGKMARLAQWLLSIRLLRCGCVSRVRFPHGTNVCMTYI